MPFRVYFGFHRRDFVKLYNAHEIRNSFERWRLGCERAAVKGNKTSFSLVCRPPFDNCPDISRITIYMHVLHTVNVSLKTDNEEGKDIHIENKDGFLFYLCIHRTDFPKTS